MTVQTSLNFDVKAARERRDDGMNRAITHAERIERGWEDMAFDFLVNVFLKHHKGPFMCEDFRASCKGVVPDPPSLRAFGGIIMKAKKRGLIQRIGIRSVKNANANCANAAVWQRSREYMNQA
jgi:hypothetical protein